MSDYCRYEYVYESLQTVSLCILQQSLYCETSSDELEYYLNIRRSNHLNEFNLSYVVDA